MNGIGKVNMKTEITVTARQWSHGWELILDEDNATQVRTLERAKQQVRDYLNTVHPEIDHSELRVHLVPERRTFS
ncbi:hypothetical protein [Kocuria carniphila]|uniref:DUF1902 domain-containing protein n=2 Tax=Kocuria carniphila TaxID=262208 RepID=A0ABV3V5S8_9MICC